MSDGRRRCLEEDGIWSVNGGASLRRWEIVWADLGALRDAGGRWTLSSAGDEADWVSHFDAVKLLAKATTNLRLIAIWSSLTDAFLTPEHARSFPGESLCAMLRRGLCADEAGSGAAYCLRPTCRTCQFSALD